MEVDRDGKSECYRHQRGTEYVAGPPVTHRRRDPHTATPHIEMGAGKRIEKKRTGWGNSNRNKQEERTETGGERNKARTNADKKHHHVSKQDRGTHAKVQREDSAYKGATASPWPSSSCAPGSISASRRMSRGSCCLAPERPNADKVEGGLHSSGLGMLARPRRGTAVLPCCPWTPGLPR